MKVCVKCQTTFPDPGATTCDRDGSELYPELMEYTRDQAKLTGCVLGGRYRIEALLGEGGMGIVLRAAHVFLGRDVAIKVLHPELTMVEDVRARFLREARAASAIRHPNIVEVTDFGLTTRGLSYLVMEYLSGDTLLSYYSSRQRLNAPQAAAIGSQICDALTALHDGGFVHRDLKPENIWVSPGASPLHPPTIKLLDFGIVGMVDSKPEQERLTRTGLTVGTPNYMAPEQVRADVIDGRADLYSLGAILWEVATGKTAVPGGSAIDVLTRQLLGEIPPPSTVVPSIPAWYDRIVMRCVEKDPANRYRTAADLKRALQEGAAQPPESDQAAPGPVLPIGVAPGSLPTAITDDGIPTIQPVAMSTGDIAPQTAPTAASSAVGLAVPGHATPTPAGPTAPVLSPESEADLLAVPRSRRWPFVAALVLLLTTGAILWAQARNAETPTSGGPGRDATTDTAAATDPGPDGPATVAETPETAEAEETATAETATAETEAAETEAAETEADEAPSTPPPVRVAETAADQKRRTVELEVVAQASAPAVKRPPQSDDGASKTRPRTGRTTKPSTRSGNSKPSSDTGTSGTSPKPDPSPLMEPR